MKLNTSRQGGFTLVEIMIVVAIIGLLASIAIPNFVRARTTAQTNTCVSNLRTLNGLKQTWGLENNAGPTTQPTTTDLEPYAGRGPGGSLDSLHCPLVAPGPLNGITMGDMSTAPSCDQYDAATHPAVIN